jgi:hypothetical protein
MLDDLACLLVESLAQELRTEVLPPHAAGLAASFQHKHMAVL